MHNKLQNLDSAIGQTAAMMWCLIRYFPLMIGDLVQEGNEYLELVLLLLECMDVLFCLEVEETLFIKHLIKEHHILFLSCYTLVLLVTVNSNQVTIEH